MTFKEIYDLVAYQSGSMGSDEGLDDLDEDGQTMVKQYINEGYDILVRDYYKPWCIQEHQLNAQGEVDTETEYDPVTAPYALRFPFYMLLNYGSSKDSLEQSKYNIPILDPLDTSAMTRFTGGRQGYTPIIGEPNMHVWIKYAHYYKHMAEETDVPNLPPQHHALMADYATYRYMSTGNLGKQQRAIFFWNRFLEGASKIQAYGVNGMANQYINLWTR